jgi:hypothetical protein
MAKAESMPSLPKGRFLLCFYIFESAQGRHPHWILAPAFNDKHRGTFSLCKIILLIILFRKYFTINVLRGTIELFSTFVYFVLDI